MGQKNGHRIARWEPIDQVVLKSISLRLSELLSSSLDPRVYHIKGRGGVSSAIGSLNGFVRRYKYVLRSDVANYYASMSHKIVLSELSRHVSDPKLMFIFHQYLNRVEYYNGEHILVKKGIVKGCSVSPLIGGIMLSLLDESIPPGCGYVRYMDDWAIFTNSRSQLRRLVKKMYKIMQELEFEIAEEKSYIGKVSNGFDFLGFKFDNTGVLGVSEQTLIRHQAKVTELYEQSASIDQISDYKDRWNRWRQTCLKKTRIPEHVR